MKHIFLTLFLFAGFVFSYDAAAINTNESVAAPGAFSPALQMSVNDFIAFDAKEYRKADGKKLKWTERLAFKLVQKNLAKKVKKGKIEGTMPMHEAGNAAGGNLYGLLSLIFSVVGLFVPFLGLALLVAALVLGIIGINRDNNPTMAIIGTVLSGLFLFLILIVLLAGAAFLWAN